MTDRPTCKTCRHWRVRSCGDFEPFEGFCTARPPVLLPSFTRGQWPLTGPNEGCGEHYPPLPKVTQVPAPPCGRRGCNIAAVHVHQDDEDALTAVSQYDPYAEALARAPRPMTAAFLRSPLYDTLMQRYVPAGGPGLHEAEERSRSYVFRHATAASALGAWRWRGMQAMVETLCSAKGNIIDFGGAASPLGLGSMVVDRAPRDAYGRAVLQHTLRGCSAPVVFTSHTLEHCEDLMGTLEEIRQALMPGGMLIAHVPAWTCERWRAGVHTAADYGDHRWTFGLVTDGVPPSDVRHVALIERCIAKARFDVQSAAYCGDDSIMVVARRA